MATPCGCPDGDYSPGCQPPCPGDEGKGDNPCPAGSTRDVMTGQCVGAGPATGGGGCGTFPNCCPGTYPEQSHANPNGKCVKGPDSPGPQGGGSGGTFTPQSASTRFSFTPIDWKQFATPNWTQINQIRDYWRNSPEYMQALRGATNMYNLFGQQGAGAYGNAVNYYNTILQGGKAASAQYLAPMYTNLADQTRQAQTSLQNNAALGGGARDRAQRELSSDAYRSSQGFIQQAQPQAAAALGQLGMSGGQLGSQANEFIGNMANVANQAGLESEAANRSLGAQVALSGQQTALGYSQLNGNMIIAADQMALQKLLGEWQRDVGMAGVNAQREATEQARNQWQTQWDWYTNTYFPQQQQQYQQQQAAAQRAQQQSKWGSLLGSALNFGANFIPFGRTGLDSLRRLAGQGTPTSRNPAAFPLYWGQF